MDRTDRREWMNHRTWLTPVGPLSARETRACLDGTFAELDRAIEVFSECERALGGRVRRFNENGPEAELFLRHALFPDAVHHSPCVRLVGPPPSHRTGGSLVVEQLEGPRGPLIDPSASMPRQAVARLELTDGRPGANLCLEYGSDGTLLSVAISTDLHTFVSPSEDIRLHEASRARPPHDLVIGALKHPELNANGHTPAEFARIFAESMHADLEGPILILPVEIPLGPDAVLRRLRQPIRTMLWNGSSELEGGEWLAFDGYWGGCSSCETSPQAAIESLERELWLRKPSIHDAQPEPGPQSGVFSLTGYEAALAVRKHWRQGNVIEFPMRSAPPEGTISQSLGTFRVSMGGFVSMHEWRALDPANAPKVLLQVPTRPPLPKHLTDAGFEPVLGLGDSGALHWLMRRLTPTELLVVGLECADLFDEAELRAAMPELENESRSLHSTWHAEHPELDPYSTASDSLGLERQFLRWEITRQRVVPWRFGRGRTGGDTYSVGVWDADELAWQVLRVGMAPPSP